MPEKVLTGIDLLRKTHFAALRGRRVGVLTHPAAVAADLTPTLDLLIAALGDGLTTIFGPEHGLLGQAQDLIAVSSKESLHSGNTAARKVYSLYGEQEASLHPTAEMLQEIDVLVVDMQDVGSRYYTFQATLLYCMQVALPLGKEIMVLDRPNPIGGRPDDVEGPGVTTGHLSFVSVHDLAIRHGLTMGEMALLYAREHKLENSRGQLTIISCQGLRREMSWEQTGLPWVLPSPNMPTPDTALVYPGQCLVEGTNLSEGRGTTRPFEISGAPWLDGVALAKTLNSLELPGVRFRGLSFRPTFQKHAGKDCGGVQIHVTSRATFRPVATSLAFLAAARMQAPEKFAWRTEIYEFVREPIAIDLLFGSSRERTAIDAGHPPEKLLAELLTLWKTDEKSFLQRSHQHWLYD